MKFLASIEHCYSNLTFKGRAPRSEFWWFFLFYIIVTLAATGMTLWSPFAGILLWIAVLSCVPVYICVVVRRLHDTNHSGWWYWLWTAAYIHYVIPLSAFMTAVLSLVPFVLFIFFLKKGTIGPNKYGPDPLDLPK